MPLPSLPRRAAAGAAAVLLACAGCAGSPERATAPKPGSTPQEREVTFESGPDTLHGTFAMPRDAEGPVPAALIVSGSGPTDRDGNSPMRPDAGTNENFARVLAEAGVASLRYDKLGSGETGMGSRAKDAAIGYDVFEQEMADAYAQLLAQPEVDPSRLIVLGHSEGGIFALRAPRVLREHPPAALVLAAPPGTRYLDTIDRQLTEQVRTAEASGSMDAEMAIATLADVRTSVARIRAGRPLPRDLSPAVREVLTPSLVPFLRRIDTMDPVDLARDVPSGVDTLVLWGTADSHIADHEVDRLMTGLDDARARRVDVRDADHVFRVQRDTPGAAVLDSQRPFSPEVAPALTEFLDTAV